MTLPDLGNAAFEFLGGLAVLRTVFYAWKVGVIRGIHWMTPAFFWSWGVWNTYYYWHLSQYLSWGAGLFIFGVNSAWLFTLWKLGDKDVGTS